MRFNLPNDTTTPADYAGDAKTDAAVFRPNSDIRYQMKSAQELGAVQFGSNGDKLILNSFVP